ncbi:MAG: polymer-forming cytoskeletal protein [Prevotellaceae bacterium]|jgi:cytoskeletal protein CcmA (bactofilin family)|nr:polymer-forming cytoskeletal protein [Prevotellaceae bacterium]
MAKENSIEPTNLNINRISEGTTIVGSVNAKGYLRIDGRVEGTITATGKGVIGNTGYIKGDLTVSTLDMMGYVEGNLIISDIIMMKSSAAVDGNVFAGKLLVESGARLNGHCLIGKKEN